MRLILCDSDVEKSDIRQVSDEPVDDQHVFASCHGVFVGYARCACISNTVCDACRNDLYSLGNKEISRVVFSYTRIIAENNQISLGKRRFSLLVINQI